MLLKWGLDVCILMHAIVELFKEVNVSEKRNISGSTKILLLFEYYWRVEILSRHTNMGVTVRQAKLSKGGEVYIQPLFQYRY